LFKKKIAFYGIGDFTNMYNAWYIQKNNIFHKEIRCYCWPLQFIYLDMSAYVGIQCAPVELWHYQLEKLSHIIFIYNAEGFAHQLSFKLKNKYCLLNLRLNSVKQIFAPAKTEIIRVDVPFSEQSYTSKTVLNYRGFLREVSTNCMTLSVQTYWYLNVWF
jgi:hypothetical protein